MRTQEAIIMCPTDGAPLVIDRRGANLDGHRLLEVIGLGDQGEVLWEIEGGEATAHVFTVELNAICMVRFRQRVARWKAADHSATPAPISSGLTPWNQPFIISKALPTNSLADCIDSQPVTEAIDIIADLLLTLSRVHEAGVYHLALSPNVIGLHRHPQTGAFCSGQLDAFETIARQPLALRVEEDTLRGPAVETLRYMAPELLVTGEGGAAADLYAVGALMYQMLAGRPPFGETTASALARAHLTQVPVPVDRHPRRPLMIPMGLTDVVNRAMHKVPGRRFATANQMHQALSTAAGLATKDSVTTINPRPRRAVASGPPPFIEAQFSPIPPLQVAGPPPRVRPPTDPLPVVPTVPEPAAIQARITPTLDAAGIKARPTPPPTDDHFSPIRPQRPPYLLALIALVLGLAGWSVTRMATEPAPMPITSPIMLTVDFGLSDPAKPVALKPTLRDRVAQVQTQVTIERDAAVEVIVGTVQITSSPDGASIRDHLGTKVGTTNWRGTLPNGRHKLRLHIPGYRQRVVEIQVTTGQTTEQHVELFRKRAHSPVAQRLPKAPAAPRVQPRRIKILGQPTR